MKNPSIKGWRYQAVELDYLIESHPCSHIEIREVVLGKDGEILGYTDAIKPFGITKEEITADLQRMLDDIKKYGVINENELPKD